MHHPFVETFESNSPRRGVSENGLCAPRTRLIKNGIVGFERRPVLRDDQQCRSMPTESRYLQISSILSDVRIIKRTFGMSLFKRPVVEHIVEDHRDAQGPELDGLRRFILQFETE